MDFLNTLAVPQSVEHFNVLLLIGGMISVILYPYLGFLLGSSFVSFFINKKGTQVGDRQFVEIARFLIDTPLYNKMVPAFLALVPAFSLMFVFAQMLQHTEAISAGLAGCGFIFLVFGIVALFTYKYTFRLRAILHDYQGFLQRNAGGTVGLGEVTRYEEENAHSHFRSGRIGIIMVALSAFLIVSSVCATTNPSSWTDSPEFFDVLLSPDVWVKVFQFAAIAVGITGVGILYLLSVTGVGEPSFDDEHIGLMRRLAFRLVVVSFLAQPFLLVGGVLLLPPAALSGLLYALLGLSLALLFLAAQLLYAFSRDARPQYVKSAAFSLFVSIVFLSMNDQVAIHSATTNHAAYLAYQYDLAAEELSARLGVASAALTGEDIYNGRCSACHLFDAKKIGPAYKDVIPAFGGDKSKIMAFVLNPVKVDPAFPPMPNQGLRPAEADSIVSYILRRLGPIQAGPAPSKEKTPQK